MWANGNAWIGTSFGTVPILAVIYCPLALKLSFSPSAIAILIAAATASEDARSPASDSTLGPTFIHYNTALILFGFINSLIF